MLVEDDMVTVVPTKAALTVTVIVEQAVLGVGALLSVTPTEYWDVDSGEAT
jgi:hypothetical protein